MAYDTENHGVQKPHQLILQDRERLTVTGVEEVESFDEGEVTMHTAGGTLLVRGEGLHVGKLSLDTGELSLEGRVSELSYVEPVRKEGFWARLLRP